jgi:hypothetical protein
VRVSVNGVHGLTSSEKGNAKYALLNMHHTAHSQYLRAHVGFKIPEGTLQSARDVMYTLLNMLKYDITITVFPPQPMCVSFGWLYIIRHCQNILFVALLSRNALLIGYWVSPR